MSSAPTAPVAHFFWEGALTNFQLLSFKSAHDAGFKVIVWSLTPHEDLPDYLEGRDSSEYLDPSILDKVFYYFHGDAPEKVRHANISLYSDFFRAAVLAKLGGWWFDADIVVLRPAQDYLDLAATRSVVIGKEQSSHVSLANGLMHFTNKHLAVEYYNMLLTKLENVSGGLPWAFFGPTIVTHFLLTKNLLKDALSEEAFYPISFMDAPKMYKLYYKGECKQLIEGSYAIHWWNSAWHSKKHGNIPPKGSFFADLFVKHGFDA